ncbi:COMM domain-containing protein 6 isoform X1 [Diceros bicornis minor]|uniref:COMM domain-containing protein 6 isoform X1 n=1 Tax=Diceros bicornis minor TaxID=77932 RepID=UPI0026EFC541|nr:COMM domain-containing protein 6 isoform X1 [Diceros bicornis minor]XP_058404295.1 COMM domain-containing protein 6 isoform X1 [Diceros bicornis minor]
MEGSSEPPLDAKAEVTTQLIDFQWKLGMAVSSDSCRSLKYPYVAVMLKVADHSGHVKNKSFEMTIPQFQVSCCHSLATEDKWCGSAPGNRIRAAEVERAEL